MRLEEGVAARSHEDGDRQRTTVGAILATSNLDEMLRSAHLVLTAAEQRIGEYCSCLAPDPADPDAGPALISEQRQREGRCRHIQRSLQLARRGLEAAAGAESAAEKEGGAHAGGPACADVEALERLVRELEYGPVEAMVSALAANERLLGNLGSLAGRGAGGAGARRAEPSPGSAAAGGVVFMYVIGAQTLLSWDPAVAGAALSRFQATVEEQLNAADGYVVELVDGLCLAAFRSAADALLWSLRCGRLLLAAPWFLDSVIVHTPESHRLLFPCHSWFGESDCGGMRGPLERNLIPIAPEDLVPGQPVAMAASGVAVPHPDKVKFDGSKGVNRKGFGHGGEDAYFYCHGRNDIFAMGVADGVFMWREQGIDSGDFSRTLMRRAAASVAGGAVDVVRVMADAAAGAAAAGVQGSSTACVVLVDQQAGQLYAANLGDSGCLLLRPEPPPAAPPSAGAAAAVPPSYKVKFRTNQLEHDFGRPYQLGHHAAADPVDMCDVATQTLRRGDVLVLGTDGLLDNLSDHAIAEAVAAGRAKREGPSALAQRLARLAFDASYDKSRSTPYAVSASEHFDMVYSGGKPDDITVLVAICG
ncbi:putative protein phosphatase 2C 55 [Tetrabaena socialis]|uniref:Protein phosphatase n=1 Tax=Tetrabaena socialis TaxID=47790 RepID=A0A2J8AE61_9CHLO|nr:putative protein phosphatase 2C 55 [Tetrabaena socialis]|eukprot:PNH10786.1 putative protein phosphatase 2C 55 [Tetrabaena socialis]